MNGRVVRGSGYAMFVTFYLPVMKCACIGGQVGMEGEGKTWPPKS